MCFGRVCALVTYPSVRFPKQNVRIFVIVEQTGTAYRKQSETITRVVRPEFLIGKRKTILSSRRDNCPEHVRVYYTYRYNRRTSLQTRRRRCFNYAYPKHDETVFKIFVFSLSVVINRTIHAPAVSFCSSSIIIVCRDFRGQSLLHVILVFVTER